MSDEQREAIYAAQQRGAPQGVRIIKRGIRPDEQLLRGTCIHCGTEVEFRRSVGRPSADQRDGNAVSIPCPVCDQRIWGRP